MKIIKKINNGELFEYQYTHESNSGGKLYLAKISLDKFKLRIFKAGRENNCIIGKRIIDKINSTHRKGLRLDINIAKRLGLIKTSDILKLSQSGRYAVNGGFFLDISALDGIIFDKNSTVYYGDPVGWQRIDGVDFGLPIYSRPALKIFENGTIDIISDQEKNVRLKIGNNVFTIYKHNHDHFLIPSDNFSRSEQKKINSSRSRNRYISISGLKVIDVSSQKPQVKNPNERIFVLREKTCIDDIPKPGDTISVVALDNPKYCFTMSPTLLKNYKIQNNRVWSKENFDEYCHPLTLTRDFYSYRAARTGIFFTKSKNEIFFAVSENHLSAYGEGLTLHEFTELVVLASTSDSLRIEQGYYLDGGSSSVLVKKEHNKITFVNTPSGISNPNVNGYMRGEEAHVGIVIVAIQKDGENSR